MGGLEAERPGESQRREELAMARFHKVGRCLLRRNGRLIESFCVVWDGSADLGAPAQKSNPAIISHQRPNPGRVRNCFDLRRQATSLWPTGKSNCLSLDSVSQSYLIYPP